MRFSTLSRTVTAPWVTRVSVPEHESCTSHLVPRTVAALYLPEVRNLPLPSPHSLRVLGLAAAELAFLHGASVSTSLRSVTPPFCESLKMPS